MVRYIALVWDETAGNSATTAAGLTRRVLGNEGLWETVYSTEGLSVFVTRSPFACYAAHAVGQAGAVLGVLFDRRDPNRTSARGASGFFDSIESAKIIETGGRCLVENYWGRYIAFLCDSHGGWKKVLRDPLGDILCYRAQVRGVHIYFSCLSDLLKLHVSALSVNWDHLALRLVAGNAWAEESALNEVECVHPGQCVEHRGTEVSTQYYWHPFAIANQPAIEHGETAAAELHATARACATGWASLHTDGVHVLSGGLDSSIVLSCLAAAPNRPRLGCVNFRTRDPDSDERSYARLIAAHSKVELAEIERQPSFDLGDLFRHAPMVGPVSTIMRGLEVQPLVAQFAQARRATAVFSGDGGDLLFFRGWPQLAVMDYAHRHWFRPELLKHALGAAYPAQLSVRRLLVDAVRHGIVGRPWSLTRLVFEHYRLITEDVIQRARQIDFLNPWNDPTGSLPPGKLLHAYSVGRPCLFRDPLNGTAPLDFINPLMSQPLVELCLRIPTYLHAAYGQDRAIARAAFASDLPPEIMQRIWKGAADRHLRDMMVNYITQFRELLLEGELVKRGILDRKRLTEALSLSPSRTGSHVIEVYGYLSTEAWLTQAREWSRTPSKV